MVTKLRVWHVDDDPFELERVKIALEQNTLEFGFDVEGFLSPEAVFERFVQRKLPDILLLDLHLGEGKPTGIEVAQVCRQKAPQAVILVCSTADDVTTIANCLRGGADDFLSKKSDKGELCLRVVNSHRLARLKNGLATPIKAENSGPPASLNQTREKGRFAGTTTERIAGRVPLLIKSAVSAVFVRGESGTGKEVVADLFQQSLPSGTPFVRLNCGAIAPNLLESELFGHVKGAFTGALSDKKGLLESANGGWIFLDEVATLSLSAQVALLRALENQEVTRVGSAKQIPIQLRVISATNEPLDELMRQGRFRKDLWQRLCETEINLPPLRERAAEIPAMVEFFCSTMPGGPYRVSASVMEVLQSYTWQDGNIRELRNCLRAMTEFHVDGLLTPLAVPERIWQALGMNTKQQSDARPLADDTVNQALGSPRKQNLETSSRSDRPMFINLAIEPTQPVIFDDLADVLLIEVAKKVTDGLGRQSLRSLARHIGMSRSTLSGRLRGAVQKGLASTQDLALIVGSLEKGVSEID